MQPPQMPEGPQQRALAPPSPMGTLSPDGMWMWNGYGWSPVTRFLSAGGRARAAVALLCVWAVVAVVAIVALAGRIQIVNDLLAGNSSGLSRSDVDNSDMLVSSSTWLELALYILVAVVFLVWLHRVVTNSYGMGEQGLRFTPGWAVGWWFIPFANFVRPAQVMAEAWRASDPRFLRSAPGTRNQVSIAVVIVWWSLFLLGDIIGRFTVLGGREADTLDGLRTNAVAAIVAEVLQLFAAFAVGWLILRITQRQAVKAQALVQPIAPPLPQTT